MASIYISGEGRVAQRARQLLEGHPRLSSCKDPQEAEVIYCLDGEDGFVERVGSPDLRAVVYDFTSRSRTSGKATFLLPLETAHARAGGLVSLPGCFASTIAMPLTRLQALAAEGLKGARIRATALGGRLTLGAAKALDAGQFRLASRPSTGLHVAEISRICGHTPDLTLFLADVGDGIIARFEIRLPRTDRGLVARGRFAEAFDPRTALWREIPAEGLADASLPAELQRYAAAFTCTAEGRTLSGMAWLNNLDFPLELALAHTAAMPAKATLTAA